MLIILLFILLWLLILTGLIYGLILLLTFVVKLFIDKSETDNLRKTKKYQRITILISICLSIIFSSRYLFSNPAYNCKTAYIEKSTDEYIITLLGKRNIMVHDPISMLKKGTYIDSMKFKIPRPEGIIGGSEIQNRPGSYKIINGKAITIKNKTMKVELFYDNYDNKKIDPSTWNGEYKLEWRTQK
jgi:hypothetical protein